MVANTRLFYKRGSPEYRDATELGSCLIFTLFFANTVTLLMFLVSGELLGKVVDAVLAGEEPSSAVGAGGADSEIGEFLEELFGAVMTVMDPAEPSRALNIVFQLLPSRKRYPEYYDDITDPMDLKTVAEKVQRGRYQSIPDMEKDLQLIFSNARTFNEPGS